MPATSDPTAAQPPAAVGASALASGAHEGSGGSGAAWARGGPAAAPTVLPPAPGQAHAAASVHVLGGGGAARHALASSAAAPQAPTSQGHLLPPQPPLIPVGGLSGHAYGEGQPTLHPHAQPYDGRLLEPVHHLQVRGLPPIKLAAWLGQDTCGWAASRASAVLCAPGCGVTFASEAAVWIAPRIASQGAVVSVRQDLAALQADREAAHQEQAALRGHLAAVRRRAARLARALGACLPLPPDLVHGLQHGVCGEWAREGTGGKAAEENGDDDDDEEAECVPDEEEERPAERLLDASLQMLREVRRLTAIRTRVLHASARLSLSPAAPHLIRRGASLCPPACSWWASSWRSCSSTPRRPPPRPSSTPRCSRSGEGAPRGCRCVRQARPPPTGVERTRGLLPPRRAPTLPAHTGRQRLAEVERDLAAARQEAAELEHEVAQVCALARLQGCASRACHRRGRASRISSYGRY